MHTSLHLMKSTLIVRLVVVAGTEHLDILSMEELIGFSKTLSRFSIQLPSIIMVPLSSFIPVI